MQRAVPAREQPFVFWSANRRCLCAKRGCLDGKSLVVVFEAEVGDEVFAHDVT
jgi:hypothetical protein